MLMFCVIPRVQQSSLDSVDVKQGSQSEMIRVGSP